MDKPTFVYVTYIATTLEQLWEALTSEAFTAQYWGDGQLQSEWQVGDSVEHVNAQGELDWQGTVLQSERPHRLTYTVQPSNPSLDEADTPIDLHPSRVRFQLEQAGQTVKLTLIHDRLDMRLDAQSCMILNQHWIVTLANLKRLLEAIALEAIANEFALVA
jgi:uncharacterized protein YndB with AHSA1/START domain